MPPGSAPVRRFWDTLKYWRWERPAIEGGKVEFNRLSDRSRETTCCKGDMFSGMGPENKLEWRSRSTVWFMRPIWGGRVPLSLFWEAERRRSWVEWKRGGG